ncbi:hypothetical protein BU15DRAFT_76010 [Melanogaster broomeanus]|nr:hypothetical protein BU15DRAFT_76010 [Melanogaster broomeanus]
MQLSRLLLVVAFVCSTVALPMAPGAELAERTESPSTDSTGGSSGGTPDWKRSSGGLSPPGWKRSSGGLSPPGWKRETANEVSA